MNWLYNLALAAVVLGWIPATLFPIFYARSPWRSTSIGKAIMVQAISIALLYNLTMLYVVVGRGPWIPYAQVVVYFAVAVGIWSQFVTLIKLQRCGDVDNEIDGKL